MAARPLRHRVLANAANLPVRRFADALAQALQARLLTTDVDERTYAFRHDLAREIVHHDLLAASRIELHVRLAVALQSDLPVDAYAGRLCEVAHHWLQTDAHEEHALRAALLAGRASTAAHAHPEAARQYGHVLRLWSRVSDPEVILGVDLVSVSKEAAEAAHWAGDSQAALRHIDQALGSGRAGAPRDEAALRERRALYAWLDSGRLQPDPERFFRIGAEATAERMRATDLMQRGRYAELVGPAERAVQLAHAAGSRTEEIRAQVVLGVGLAMSDRTDRGIAMLGNAKDDAGQLQNTELIVSSHINLTFVLLSHGELDEAARIAMLGLAEVTRLGVAGSDGALIASNAAEALTRLGRLDEAERLLLGALDAELPPAVESVLLLGRAAIEVLTARFGDAESTLRAIAGLAPLENHQFQQQLDVWEAELQLWDPAAGHAVRLGDLRGARGSSLVRDLENDEEDPALSARLLWLGVRADADAATSVTDRDGPPRRALVDDGNALADRARRLATAPMTAGMLRQVEGLLALVDAEQARLGDGHAPEVWQRAVEGNAGDPYLRGYAGWRHGCALRALRRRREAAEALRAAHAVAEPLGIRTVVEAVLAAGLSLDVRVDQIPRPRSARQAVSRPFNLTPKEVEVLALLVRGYTNRRIGSTLRMTEKTASVHVSRILAKMSVGSRGEAVARAYEVGLASVPRGR